jgi:NADPH:quinone reductase
MTADLPEIAVELWSLVTSQGTLELSLQDVPVPTPAANEVLVRAEASPINPSDLGLLIAGADMATATVAGTRERPIVQPRWQPGRWKGFRHDSTNRSRWAMRGG